MSVVLESHIRLDERGTAWIDDSNIKVIEIAAEHLAHGNSADEIFEQHGGYLTLAQIYSALAFYHDHQAEFDRQIAAELTAADAARAASLDSPGRRRLQAAGKLP